MHDRPRVILASQYTSTVPFMQVNFSQCLRVVYTKTTGPHQEINVT